MPEDFFLVPAGGEVSATVELSEGYSISTAGVYTVQLETVIQYYPICGSTRDRAEEVLLSPPVTFQVLGSGKGRLTEGEKARQGSITSLAGPQVRAPVCRGGNSAERAKCVEIHNRSHEKILNSIWGAYTNTTVYKEWFGNISCCRNTVVYSYYWMYDVMERETITYVMHGSKCKRNTYAYTYKGGRTVYYCDVFWRSNDFYPPHDSKICTCVHELSHAIAYTDDIAYGTRRCKELAKRSPAKAARNADNYGYYAEIH